MKRAFAVAMFLLTPAFGQSSDELYAQGQYDASIRAALEENDAAGFANAARATLAEEAGRVERCLPCLERAEDFARRAIAADPKFPDGHIYLAIALGLESRIEGYGVALRRGYADEAKSALDAALARDPDNVWALAGLGGWNIEVVRGGGSFLAYLLYGATVDNGLDDFAKALRDDPGNLAIRYQYGLTLAGYDAQRFRNLIEESLSQATRLEADTAYNRLLQKRAGELLALLRNGDRAAFAARVRVYEGYVSKAGE